MIEEYTTIWSKRNRWICSVNQTSIMPKTTPKLNQTAQTRGSTAWAYVLADAGNGLPDGILIGSSREVHRWIDVDEHRKAGGI